MHTVFILINTPGALQFMRAKKLFMRQNLGTNTNILFNVVEPFGVAIAHLFSLKIRRGIY